MPSICCRRRALFSAFVVFSACLSLSAVAEEEFSRGKQAYLEQNWQAAAESFEQFLSSDEIDEQRRLSAHFYVGECRLQLGDRSTARQHYQVVKESSQNSQHLASTLFRLGEIAWLEGERETAFAMHDQFVRDYPANRYASNAWSHLLDYAVAMEREGRVDAALLLYHRAVSNSSSGELQNQAMFLAARLHERMGGLHEAAALYEQLLSSASPEEKIPEVHLKLAWVYQRQGEPEKASRQFQILHENFPQTSQAEEAAYWLALQAADKQDSTAAESYVDWLLQKYEAAEQERTRRQQVLEKQTLCFKCQLLADQDEWASVNKLMERHQTLVDDSALGARLLFWKAEAAFRKGEIEQAGILLKQLTSRTIGISEPWVAMVGLRQAQLAVHQQRWTEVLTLVNELQAEHPDFPLMYEADYLRGRALAGQGKMNAARRWYRQVGDCPEAANTVIATKAQWMIGETYFHQQDYARARQAYLRVIEDHTHPQWQARAALQAGKCWELDHQWQAAIETYERALDRWQETDSASQLQARLTWAKQNVLRRQ